MAFQTNVLRGGEWVTETINLQAVLKANSSTSGHKKPRPLKAPQCGILTRTVVESHLVGSIHPVRLRSPQQNDVAFIGDHDVRICELRRDGQLKEIARKSDFGSRIRNSCVVGSFYITEDNNTESGIPASMADDDDPLPHISSSAPQGSESEAPPQWLMLVLECGDCVFLFLRRGLDGRLEFVTSRFPSPREQLVYPGFHLAIDPSSRYVALACAQDYFVVCELESVDKLGQAARRNESLRPVLSIRPRSVQGVIHKITFLYPRPGDDHHVILLLVIVKNGRSRMVIYEWALGDDLRLVLAEEKQGHRMPVENQMPVLIIPLTVRSAFIAISPEQVAVCTEVLHGSPNFECVELQNPAPTPNHHGREEPLWTAWSRPFRLAPYFKTKDCIYLAREDGVVIFIEADWENPLDRSTFMKTFDSNISRAFTCLFDEHADVLVLGSDSGPGAIWKVAARQPLVLVGTLPNWSPAVDFATTDEFASWNQEVGAAGNKMLPWKDRTFRKPDRVFATSGHGKKGSITEYRYGLTAGIGLDLDYGTDIKEAWLFAPKRLGSQEGFHLILSMPDCSGLLQISRDFSQAQEVTSDNSGYDLSSPTLALAHSGSLLVQVTKESIALLGPDKSIRFRYEDVLPCAIGLEVSDACIMDGLEVIDVSQALADQTRDVEGLEVSAIDAIASIVCAWGAIVMGTRSGEVVKITDNGVKYEKFGMTAARLSCVHLSQQVEPTVLLSCDKSLVLLRGHAVGNALFDSDRLEDKLRIWPVDASNLAAAAPPVDFGIAVDLPFENHDTTPILMTSGSNILLAELEHQPRPAHRHLPVGGTPMKVIYSQHLQCLVIAVSKEEHKPTLMFMDPDTGKDIGRPTDRKTNTAIDFIPGLGRAGDRIYGLTEWDFKKDGNLWRYILVSTKDGRLIVVSTAKGETRDDKASHIRYWVQFQKKGYNRPVYSVVGYEEGLVYCVGQTIYWDVLDTAEKKLKTIKSFELGSPATSLRITNGKLMALSSRESLEVIDHSAGGDEGMAQTHVDPKTRNAIHMIEVAGTQPEDPLGSITLLADRDCGVAGLWVPWQTPGKDCEPVFEAELQASIRRFRRGRTRPMWEQSQHIPKYGRLASTVDDAEILGISLDGSMQHFTFLNTDTWRLLRFIQNVAMTNEELYPYTHQRVDDYNEFDPEPRPDRGFEMHVDGDMLRRCLEKRALERLLSWPEHEGRFIELLNAVDEGRRATGLRVPDGREQHFKMAYDILDYFLRPVL
ncbi:hypothetical protein OQA88_7783 [Cercophora sp. LCS_1]